MEPAAYLGGALGHAPFYIGQILENLVSLPLCVSTSAQRKCAPFWNHKYSIAWSSAPDPAGKRIVLHKFRSSYLGIELGRRKKMRCCGIERKGEPVLMDHFNQCLCTKLFECIFKCVHQRCLSPNPFPKPFPGYNRDLLSVRAMCPQFSGTSRS